MQFRWQNSELITLFADDEKESLFCKYLFPRIAGRTTDFPALKDMIPDKPNPGSVCQSGNLIFFGSVRIVSAPEENIVIIMYFKEILVPIGKKQVNGTGLQGPLF